MFGTISSVTGRRTIGAMLFLPLILVFLLSQSTAQWILFAIAGVMVWEFTGMVRLSMPLRATILMDFALFALPAPYFIGLEMVAGMSLLPVVLGLVIGCGAGR